MKKLKISHSGNKMWVFERPQEWQIADKKFDRAVDKMQAGDLDGAGILFEEIIKSVPNHLDARNNFACVLYETGEIEIAFFHWKENMRIGFKSFPRKFVLGEDELNWYFPDNRSFLNSLKMVGIYYQRLGDIPRAKALFEQILKLSPNDNQGIRLLIEEMQYNTITNNVDW